MAKPRPLAPTAQTTVTEEATLPERDSAEIAPPAYAAELATLRERLRAVEAALGLPLRPGQPVPPDLPALRRRVATLERHLGLAPGLVPLPGCDEAAPPARATTIASEPDGREPAWRARGRAALALAALVAALAWLLHPLPGGPGFFRAAEPTARPEAGAPTAPPAPVAVPAVAPAQPGASPCVSIGVLGVCAPPAPGDDAAGANTPFCDTDGAVIGNACSIP